MEEKTRYLWSDDDKILVKDEPGKALKKYVMGTEDDWAFDRELYRMFFGDFEVREVPESEVPALKKIAKDWACNMPDWPEQLAKMQAKNVKNCS